MARLTNQDAATIGPETVASTTSGGGVTLVVGKLVSRRLRATLRRRWGAQPRIFGGHCSSCSSELWQGSRRGMDGGRSTCILTSLSQQQHCRHRGPGEDNVQRVKRRFREVHSFSYPRGAKSQTYMVRAALKSPFV